MPLGVARASDARDQGQQDSATSGAMWLRDNRTPVTQRRRSVRHLPSAAVDVSVASATNGPRQCDLSRKAVLDAEARAQPTMNFDIADCISEISRQTVSPPTTE